MMATRKEPTNVRRQRRGRKPTEPQLPRGLDTDRDPWERQSFESDEAFAGFQHYRDADDGRGDQASIRSTARALSKSVTLIGEWSTDYRWVERRAAWLAEQDRVRRDRVTRAIGTMAHRHVVLAQSVQQQVAARLAGVTAADVSGVTWRELARLLAEATRLERLALGEPTDLPGVPAAPHPAGPEAGAAAVEQLDTPARLARVLLALAEAEGQDAAAGAAAPQGDAQDA
jgi:hypothetical protein